MKNLIKTSSEETALRLEQCGFSYVIEKINNNQRLFVFKVTTELLDVIRQHFSLDDMIADDTLYF